jgi:hypothetical protein
VGADGTSSFGSPDLATTVAFSDDPIVARTTIVRRVHVIELRDAVNLVRNLAGRPVVSWSDSIVSESTPVRSDHIVELRSALVDALNALGVVPPSFTGSATPGSTIRASDIQELRDTIR